MKSKILIILISLFITTIAIGGDTGGSGVGGFNIVSPIFIDQANSSGSFGQIGSLTNGDILIKYPAAGANHWGDIFVDNLTSTSDTNLTAAAYTMTEAATADNSTLDSSQQNKLDEVNNELTVATVLVNKIKLHTNSADAYEAAELIIKGLDKDQFKTISIDEGEDEIKLLLKK